MPILIKSDNMILCRVSKRRLHAAFDVIKSNAPP